MKNNLLFLIIGIGLLIGAGYTGWHQHEFIQQSRFTHGVVIDNVYSGGKHATYHAVVQFMPRDGTQQITFQSNIGTNPAMYHVNQPVDVLYSQANPQEAQINSPFDLWFLTGMITFMGLIFTFVSLAPLIKTGRNHI